MGRPSIPRSPPSDTEGPEQSGPFVFSEPSVPLSSSSSPSRAHGAKFHERVLFTPIVEMCTCCCDPVHGLNEKPIRAPSRAVRCETSFKIKELAHVCRSRTATNVAVPPKDSGAGVAVPPKDSRRPNRPSDARWRRMSPFCRITGGESRRRMIRGVGFAGESDGRANRWNVAVLPVPGGFSAAFTIKGDRAPMKKPSVATVSPVGETLAAARHGRTKTLRAAPFAPPESHANRGLSHGPGGKLAERRHSRGAGREKAAGRRESFGRTATFGLRQWNPAAGC